MSPTEMVTPWYKTTLFKVVAYLLIFILGLLTRQLDMPSDSGGIVQALFGQNNKQAEKNADLLIAVIKLQKENDSLRTVIAAQNRQRSPQFGQQQAAKADSGAKIIKRPKIFE